MCVHTPSIGYDVTSHANKAQSMERDKRQVRSMTRRAVLHVLFRRSPHMRNKPH